ncbi:pyocin knob domain-containing protein [Paraprevotella clara]|uniref:pyocin knob domain-containing protein n=1 Tax=Paraprevotella clara TaxID=454154 RepID=UPI00266C6FBF|nr:pyocin knob domain-containing protein [Paraprevotella clara]
MAVEGKTILQTTERTELTGKEGIPFQEGTQNGHVLLEKIKEYISSDVYICPGAFQTTEGWSTTDVESIVGNWDEFTKAVSGGKIIIGYFQNEGQFVKSTASVIENDGVTFLSFSFYQLLCVYIIDQSYITIVTIDNFLCVSSVVDRLNSSGTELPLSANQGRILNEKIAEISNPVSAEKDGLMSKEDKEAFDNMKDGGAIEYKEISGQTVDADDLIVPKLTVRYLNKNASTAENISNIPAKGGFVLESMCVRYVDEDNCGYIQTYYSQNSDSRILPFSLTRQYTNGKWTEWRSTVGRYLCVNEAYEKVGTTFLGTGFQVGNIFDRSIVKDGALAISTQDVALHLTGVKNSTTYKVVSNSSVGYWMMKNCPEQFFHAGKVVVSEDKTSESDETKKEYVAEVVSVDAEGGTVTFSESLNPYTDFNDYSASFKAYAENGSLCLSAGTSTFLGIAGEECVAGAESADGCVALGDRCVSTGGCSVALCWQTVARNFAETALGISNKSHKGDSADKQTLFSIGNGTQYFNDWGTAKQKNAMEVMKNGDMYIEGVGGYDGINDGFTAQSVQEIISGLLSEISALKEEIEALKGSGA